MRRICVVVAVLIGIVAPATLPSAQGAPPRPTWPTGSAQASSMVVTHSRMVRLITGDTVQVMTRADGGTMSKILAGPHANSPVARWPTGRSSYLMPRIPALERRRLDLSLFDVSRLAALRGPRVPIVVTLRRHAAASSLHALDAALSLPRGFSRTAGTARVVPGWYSVGFRGLDPRELAAVRSIRLAEGPARPQTAGRSHVLTVQVRTAAGGPARGVVVFIENVDNADSFLQTIYTDNQGNVSVTVPDGDYSVLAWNFSRLLVVPEFAVTADKTVSLDLGDATVRPHVSLPNYRVAETVLSVGRTPDSGFSFPVQFSGPRFFMRVQPASGHVSQGALHTGVSAKLFRIGSGPAHSSQHLAVTADVSSGVPDDLTFHHHRRDFARVVQRFFGNGPAGPRQTFLDGGGVGVDLWTGQVYDTRVPGRRVVLLQAARNAYYQQTLLPQAPPGSNNLTQLATVRRYLTPELTHVVTFAHGPVGPGSEGRNPFPGVIRRSGHLMGYLPLFSGAGSAMDSWVAARDGSWRLRHDDHTLRRGRHEIYFNVAVPARRLTYVLRAISHPTAHDWDLSTRVADRWTFHSRAHQSPPPLLTPSYVPPSTMNGYVRPGRTHFALRFRTSAGPGHRISQARFRLSTDGGRRWTQAGLVRRGPDAFRVSYLNPAAHPHHRFMSLRVTGRDAHGNAVRETATNVYRLR